MKHSATPDFWRLYNALPQEVRTLADKNYALLKMNPNHLSLRFKSIDSLWSIRVGSHYRALGKMAFTGSGSARMPTMTSSCRSCCTQFSAERVAH